jgi:hypothetical protein
MLKVPKKIIPYDIQRPEKGLGQLAAEDYDTVRELVKSKDEKKLQDFINKRLIDYERTDKVLRDRKIIDASGLSVRDYLENLTGEAILRNNPDIAKIASENRDAAELGKIIRKKMLPDIEDALKAYKLSTDIVENPFKDNVELGENEGRVNLSGRGETPAHNIGTAVHELAHLNDLLARKYSKDKYISEYEERPVAEEREGPIRKFLKSKPAAEYLYREVPGEEQKFFKKPTDTELKNKYGQLIKNLEIPNFSDYNFATGEFGSNLIREPLEKQKESSFPHFLNRNQSYENMIKALEDEGKLDRLTKFEKLKKILV